MNDNYNYNDTTCNNNKTRNHNNNKNNNNNDTQKQKNRHKDDTEMIECICCLHALFIGCVMGIAWTCWFTSLTHAYCL